VFSGFVLSVSFSPKVSILYLYKIYEGRPTPPKVSVSKRCYIDGVSRCGVYDCNRAKEIQIQGWF
jgi:hypothetical protein